MKNFRYPILILAVLLLFGCVQNSNQKPVGNSESEINIPSNFKIYNNEKYDFSIAFPEDFKIDEKAYGPDIYLQVEQDSSKKIVLIHVTKYDDRDAESHVKARTEFINKDDPNVQTSNINTKTIEIEDIKFHKLTYDTISEKYGTQYYWNQYYFNGKNNAYGIDITIQLSKKDEYLDFPDRIIRTIKLMK